MAAWTLVNVASAGSINSNNVTTPGIDTTGATLLIAWGAWDTSGGVLAFTDSKGNSWNKLTSQILTVAGSFWWCIPTSVGAAHTFTGTLTGAFPTICVTAWSANAASPFDQQNGGTSSAGTTLATGSVTPTENTELIIAGIAIRSGSTSISSIDSGFTISGNIAPSANCDGAAIAWKLQTTLAAVNPTWTVVGSGSVKAAAIATFKNASPLPTPVSDGNMLLVF